MSTTTEVLHGQKYKVLTPTQIWERANPGKTYYQPRIYGQGNTVIDRYTLTNGKSVYEDVFGDVVTASDNVDYPHGPNANYRNTAYIADNIERFELIEDVAPPTEE